MGVKMSPLHVARALIVALALLAYAPAILFGDLQHLNVEDDVHLPRGRPATLGAALRWCAFEAPRLGTAGPLGACLQVAVNWVGASAAAARVASLACHLWVAISVRPLLPLGDDAAAARRPSACSSPRTRSTPRPSPGRACPRSPPRASRSGAHKALDGRPAPPRRASPRLTKATAVGSPALVAFALVAVDRGWTDAEKLRHALRSTARPRRPLRLRGPAPRRPAAASGDAAARLLVFEGWRDALAAAAWYAWSLAAPPDNPPALRYSAFGGARVPAPRAASPRLRGGVDGLPPRPRRRRRRRQARRRGRRLRVACLLAPRWASPRAPAYGLVADRYAYLPAAGARRTAARLAAYASPLALYTAATSANPGDFESWAALGHATKEDPTKDDNDTDLGHESLSYYSRAMEAGAGEKPCGIAEVMTQYLGSNLDAAACWERRAGSDRPAAARLEARAQRQVANRRRHRPARRRRRRARRAAPRLRRAPRARQRAAPAPRRRRRRGRLRRAAPATRPGAPHLNWGILEIDRENRDAAYGHFRDQLARAPNRGSLRRLKILRDINEGDPTIAKIVADFEARHAELG
ncbi:hypothetical protein JL720_14968 [Aureococcus anophagefferens]|nr:hypothetical protein JL720_14968 [Aureococcus anophagefferens]